ncbi:MAG: hypothetical protein IT364_23735 [Candidatus Hydrogenedentes bacterium]|nr:hypothetical protein [Candidatus Hydrogenedentota bacterium]
MMDTNVNTWTEEAKTYLEGYLSRVEALLTGQGGDAREVVNDLRDHVERLAVTDAGALVALSDVKRLLSTVGTPEEVAASWAELGDKADAKDPWSPSYLNATPPAPDNTRRAAWIIAAAAIVFVLPFLVYMIRGEVPDPTPPLEQAQETVTPRVGLPPVRVAKENDPTGSWVSVDFVERVEDFQPGKKAWAGELFLKNLECFADGRTSIGEHWKNGQLMDQESPATAPYYLKNLDNKQYLFLPWFSGDVTIRGQNPRYYVLARSEDVGETVAEVPKDVTPTGAEAQGTYADLTGSWTSVDFVAKVEDFKPGAKSWSGELFLKDLDCTPNGGTSLGYTWWADGRVIGQDGKTQATYQVKTFGDNTYLFLPWLSGDVTIRGMAPKYYVLKRQASTSQTASAPAQSGGDITGVWRSVDFVPRVEDFQPGRRNWRGDLFLKELSCSDDGTTSIGYTWSSDGRIVSKDGKAQARFYTKQENGGAYLFLPWLSGDVTIRGMAPKYYVMQKAG